MSDLGFGKKYRRHRSTDFVVTTNSASLITFARGSVLDIWRITLLGFHEIPPVYVYITADSSIDMHQLVYPPVAEALASDLVQVAIDLCLYSGYT